ncbi:hypothetical protein [Paenibacillus ginsengihumi]|uniref:hypothetical protein n=1 Tax=Paenibacillus ginsengihumi TaxID=431596 RepID=UPI0003795B66|nr:hypothetical protein [Paenibacillus ginsengihumi]
MDKAKAQKWKKTREMGKGKYVMLFGVAAWGITLTVAFTLVEWLTQQTFTPLWFYIRFFVFGFAGFLIANFRWESMERLFKQHNP